MATRKKNVPTPVDAITHGDKRVNLPTADAHDFVAPELDQPIPLRYPRDPSLDPQLVWKGKDALDGEDLVADAPPIYIQEKIDPRALVQDFRNSKSGGDPDQLAFFESFDGLSELDMVDFYQHEANWSNRMILGDSLNVMASLAEREALRGKVQMIYMDPPYGIKFKSNWQVSARDRDVKDGKMSNASREVEQIKAFRDTWELGIHSYLTYLRDRLVVARDLLTSSGSIFVQIGDENVHLVRSVLDEVFGRDNFVSLITFVTTSGFTQASALPRNGDYLLWYARDLAALKVRTLWAEARDRQGYRWLWFPDGDFRGTTASEYAGTEALPQGARLYKPDNILSQGAAGEPQPFDFLGKRYFPLRNSHWKAAYPSGMEKLAWAGRIHVARNSIQYRRFADDFPYQVRTNLWTDTGTGNFTDDKIYVVQTNTKVVERCMLMTTDPGDLVLDPTCGSGTAAYVAEQWGRRWITIDTSRVALALARQRLMGSIYPWYILADSVEGQTKEAELSGSAIPPGPVTNDIRHGFVYERARHITLESIANNPNIRPGMSVAEIDVAIQRHAPFELLRDKPFTDSRKVRVSGPFTMESLSPHRALAYARTGVTTDGELRRVEPEGGSGSLFEQTILANLRAAGIQNGRQQQRLSFDSLEPHAASYIQAIGHRANAAEGTPKRIGITIGPQYGTVGPGFIKDAAREANRAEDIDLLCVLAFAFDPAVLGSGDEYVTSDEGFANVAAARRLGRVPVLLVRMNADLVMGDELKKTGDGNLFTVFGEPDIEIEETERGLQVTLRGVDVYDPNTGKIRTNDVDHIALWMIDTAYNGESFFVRQCYFTGGQDPYEKLKKVLKADVDPAVWASLYQTESRRFPRPSTGKIAVKVINDYGDEVMKVFSV